MRKVASILGVGAAALSTMLLNIPAANAGTIGTYSCSVPYSGAKQCANIEVSAKQAITIELNSSEGVETGFCLQRSSNGNEVGDCRAINEGGTSAVLWTNPQFKTVNIDVMANANPWYGTTDINFTVKSS
ncbi:hypothetical protein GCM10027444_44060 [Actinopolyspora lacussalsi]